MTKHIDVSQIYVIAERYSDSNEPFVEQLQPDVRRQGYLTIDQLLTLCQWKSPRSAGRVRRNAAPFVEEITRFALSASDERARIEPLTLLDGVDYPTASCILHWFHADPYPILDVRALWSLQLAPPSSYSFRFWWSYCVEWRRLLVEAMRIDPRVTPRLFDKALWQFSFEEQNE